MAKAVPLKKNYEFARVYKQGRFQATNYLVIYILKNNLGINRIGITVSKKVGKAVIRNRIRRLVKENFRQVEGLLKNGYDMVIVSRKKENIPLFKDINREMHYLLKKLDMYKAI